MNTTGATNAAATVIIGQRIRAGQDQAFETWQSNMNREAAKYPESKKWAEAVLGQGSKK